MGIYATDLRELVIRPTLELLDQWSPAAENLLLGTAAQESQLGFKLHTGELKGIYRISDRTHLQVWDKFLVTNPELASRVRGLASQQQFLKNPHAELITNLSYASGIAWMYYLQQKVTLPAANNIRDLAQCWLQFFAGRDEQYTGPCDTERELEKFETNYRKWVLREHKKMAA